MAAKLTELQVKNAKPRAGHLAAPNPRAVRQLAARPAL